MNQDRRKKLLKLLAAHQTASIRWLADALDVSPATARRDIDWLASRNLLVRTRGGAQSAGPKSQQNPLSSEAFQKSILECAARKRAIAKKAASMCVDGETIIINGGTTTFMMAEFLIEKNMRILTNSFPMAQRLLATSENEIVLSGGNIYREQNVILAPFDNDVTQSHYASKMFTSVYGLSLLGLMEADPLLIQAEQRLIKQAEELIVVADSSKFGRNAGLIMCRLDQVARVITDTDVSDKAVQMLEHQGIQVITVPAEEPRLHAEAAVPGRRHGREPREPWEIGAYI
ncbi:DeoR/GlpR family DNA-binding transcription regulator [Massilia orientalis]|uniref:DeoR/GlpR family DNA-binding transcription regulator n=1 Tax=Massilia orientalis TaxID=3050128 RepID=A0ACC7MIJ5_9BURK|nr:DeoR/GlpR family DNA-binding transcription regulator [Massilia sp. YIM B02787]